MGVLSRLFNIDLFTLIARAAIILTALPVHEWAHAFAADRMGDPTAREQGRLTLNPLAHIDARGALLIMVAGIGFAKPVPVDPRNFRNRKAGEIIVSLAGPFSNILISLICMIIFKIGYYYSALYASAQVARSLGGIVEIFWYMALINGSLAIFNLIPCPPLDGWHVLAQLLPRRAYNWMVVNQGYLSMFLIAAVIFGFLDEPLRFLRNYLVQGIILATSFVELLFGV